MAMNVDITDQLTHADVQRLLATRALGRRLHVLDQTPSTNDDVKRLALRGAPEGTVVLADHQTQGRGRQGRAFASPAGVGIYLSTLLRPTVAPTRLPQLTLMVAVAAAEALSEVSGIDIGLKWPNDVEIHGKKVAGILTEAVLRPGGPPAVVIGIGINVNTRLEQLPRELHERVTSLALAAGRRFARPALIAALLARLERLYEVFQTVGISPIRTRWLDFEHSIGRQVGFEAACGPSQGTITGLDNDGALLVQVGRSAPQRVIAGEVTFL
jgi:BirA family biotin operon repressor/biotin-[acetyl-CoA-carboxylase] ligase